MFDRVARSFRQSDAGRVWGRGLLVSVPLGWLLLFFLVPFLIVLKISFAGIRIGLPPYTDLVTWADPSTWVLHLNLQNYQWVFQDDLYLVSFLKTLVLASFSTLACLLVAYPMALAMTRFEPPVRMILVMLVILPFWTSFVIRVYAWINLLSPQGIINTFLMATGLVHEPLNLMYHDPAVCLGIVYSYLPFMVLPLYAILEKIDPALSEAAEDLGCTPWRTFWFVTLPLSRSGILAGSLLVFISSVGEYVIPELLGGADCVMMARVLWVEFFTNSHWPVAAALSVVLLVVVVVPVMMVHHRVSRQGHIREEDPA